MSALEQHLEAARAEVRQVSAEKRADLELLYTELKKREQQVADFSAALADRNTRLSSAESTADEVLIA